MIAQAQSGTGKTGAFSVGVLHNVDTSINKVQAVILVPTRELAKQIQDVISSLGTFMKQLKIQLLVGGTSTEQDVHALKNNTPTSLWVVRDACMTCCAGNTFAEPTSI